SAGGESWAWGSISRGGSPSSRRWYPPLAAPRAIRHSPMARARPDRLATTMSRSSAGAMQADTEPPNPMMVSRTPTTSEVNTFPSGSEADLCPRALHQKGDTGHEHQAPRDRRNREAFRLVGAELDRTRVHDGVAPGPREAAIGEPENAEDNQHDGERF